MWAVDFEFYAPPGERPLPLCLVAREILQGRLVTQWLLDSPAPRPPWHPGTEVLVTAYYASAELGCCLALE